MAKKGKQEEQITLDDIVNTITILGIPKNEKNKEILRSKLYSLVKEDEPAFFDKMLGLSSKDIANNIVIYLQDLDIIKDFGLRLIETDFHDAYFFGRDYAQDEDILNECKNAIIQNNPKKAYSFGEMYDDQTLIKQSFPLLVEQNPIQAFDLEYDRSQFQSKKNRNRKHFVIVGEKLLGLNHLKAYKAAVYSGDADLLVKARKALAEHDAITAFHYALHKPEDTELFRLAGFKLVPKKPKKIYCLGKQLNDDELIDCARKELYKYPSSGFEIGKRYKDKKLLNKSGWSLLNRNPRQSYEAGILTGDQKLIAKARYSFVKMDAKEAYEFTAYSKKQDKTLLRIAGWKLLKSDPLYSYYAGFDSGNKRLIDRSRTALMEYNLYEAKGAAENRKDKEFLEMIMEKNVSPILQELYERENKT